MKAKLGLQEGRSNRSKFLATSSYEGANRRNGGLNDPGPYLTQGRISVNFHVHVILLNSAD